MAKLRPRARIIRTIGDQLISGPEAALIELVKNSFDADSPAVHIKIFPSSTTNSGGKIFVQDTGHGMSAIDLVDKWFEPATSDKLERRFSPDKGRRMLGAKGVGRFATARLGETLHLTTTSKLPNGKTEISDIRLNWSQFEQSRYLDEIDVEISTRIGSDNDVTGVTLEIESLRDQWTKKQLELLVRELRRMVSPLETREDNFRIFLDLTEFVVDTHGFDGQAIVSGILGGFTETNGLQTTEWLEIKPFRLEKIFHYMVDGEFDENGAFKGVFVNQRGDSQEQELLMEASALTDEEVSCGPFHLRLNIYDREGDAVVELLEKVGLSGIGKIEAKRVLDENIGIGIYRNNFRIRPYGDAETDWLELESMRVQNPSRKLGLNQVWGMVAIEDESISKLTERSSREGLEHNGSFLRLKRLMTELLAKVESLRQDFRQSAQLSRKNKADTEHLKDKASMQATTKAVSKLPIQYRVELEKALKADSTALKTSIEELETYQQVLVSRSTLGSVVSQILHDGRRFLSDISTRSKRLSDGAERILEKTSFGAHFRASFGKEALSIHSSSIELNRLFKNLDPISGKKLGPTKDFNVYKVVRQSLKLFTDRIQASSISVNLDPIGDDIFAHGHESALMPALINIIDNAVHWLSTSPKSPRTLSIKSIPQGKYIKIIISNNGPLIDEKFREKLFDPGFSLKTQGSGIGLAIARESLRTSKGDIALDTEAGETTFVIEMLKAEES